MKFDYIKKIVFATAFITGGVFLINAGAQTTIYSGNPTPGFQPGPPLVAGYTIGTNFSLASGSTINYSFTGYATNPAGTPAVAILAYPTSTASGSRVGFGSTSITTSSANYSGSFVLSGNATSLFLGGDGFAGPSGTLYYISNLLLTLSAGLSAADTQASLQNTAAVLNSTYVLQNSVVANSLSYDCQVFDKNNICVSAGGRYTAVSAANGLNNTSALLIAGYRPHPNYRIGAYLDQNLSVNNMGSTVRLDNGAPLFGLFGAWNERLDGTGTEVKVSAAIGQKNTTVTRAVIGTSEAGAGSANLNSQGIQLLAKYGFAVLPEVVVSPYAGIRYSQNNMGGYTEATSSTVTAPLTFSALNTNATTLLAGVGATFKPTPVSAVFASVGLESDVATKNGSYSASGVSGLTAVNFNANSVKNRPTATLGAYYDIEKNQRLSVSGIYRQESYQKVATTTALATYTVGF